MDKDALDRRIAEEKAKIKIDTYQDVAYEGSFRGGGRGLWSAGLLGMVTGALIGAAAPLVPLLVVGSAGFAAASAAIPASIAVFAALGVSAGFAGGAMVGRSAGGVGSVAKEQELRIKSWTIEKILNANPNAKIEHEREPEKQKSTASIGEKIKSGWRKYFNIRTALFFTLAGAIGGAVMGAGFLASGGAAAFAMGPALGTITGLGAAAFEGVSFASAAAPAILAYSTGVAALFGFLAFGTNYPKIATELQTLTGNLLSGKYLGREFGSDAKPHTTQLRWGQPQAAPEASQEALVVADDMLTHSAHPNVAVRRFDSFREMIVSGKNAALEAGESLMKR